MNNGGNFYTRRASDIKRTYPGLKVDDIGLVSGKNVPVVRLSYELNKFTMELDIEPGATDLEISDAVHASYCRFVGNVTKDLSEAFRHHYWRRDVES